MGLRNCEPRRLLPDPRRHTVCDRQIAAAAPFAGILWMETKTAADARQFAEAIHAGSNWRTTSPSFNTGHHRHDRRGDARRFPEELRLKMGFVFNFTKITYGGHRSAVSRPKNSPPRCQDGMRGSVPAQNA